MTSATVTAPTWTALHVLSRGLLVVSALYGSAAVVAVAADAPLAPLGVALLGVGLTGLVLAHGLGTRASRLVVVSATTAAAVAGLTGVALRLGGPGALWHVLLIGYAVAAVAFFVVFESMVSLSDALDLPWARARWCTARWTSLAPLACVALLTVDPRLLAVLSRIPLPGLDRGLGSSVAAMAALSAPLLAIPLAQIVFGVVATSADLRQLTDGAAEELLPRRHSPRGLGADEVATLLVLAGNSLWAVGVLLGSVVLFDVGASAVIAGFGYNADLRRGEQGPVGGPARWMRAGWRQLSLFAALFVTCFVFSRQAPPGSPIALALAGLITVAAAFMLDPQHVSRSPASGLVDLAERARMQRASVKWGRFLAVIGWALLGGGALVFGHAMFMWLATLSGTEPSIAPPEGIDWDRSVRMQMQILAGVMIASSGSQCRLVARRLRAPVVDPTQLQDPFVLYLRPFCDDRRLAGLESWPRTRGALIPQVWFHEILLCGRSEEEHLVDALKRMTGSPVVAVGAPGEWRPPGGAIRVYLDAPDWQPRVRALLPRARLVVIALGHGEGTRWELVEAMLTLKPQRLLLVIAMPADEYRLLRQELLEALAARAEEVRRRTGQTWTPPTLPDFPSYRVKMRTEIQAIVSFTDDWQPIASALGRERYPTFYDTLRLPLRVALAPVLGRLRSFEGNGIPDNVTKARIAALVGGQFVGAALTLQVFALASFVALYIAGVHTKWSDLPWWVQLGAVVCAPWLTFYGRMLRYRGVYFLNCGPAEADGWPGSDRRCRRQS